ncbi:hypothetical protein [Arthrobacter methylotrophus]|uniref:hypothetical protein n=1 Tax=Arthrobacter methylotrophus TaxID=121291 RepID=UPI0031F04024
MLMKGTFWGKFLAFVAAGTVCATMPPPACPFGTVRLRPSRGLGDREGYPGRRVGLPRPSTPDVPSLGTRALERCGAPDPITNTIHRQRT